ncbi:MAG: septal ring lytic transglycosylase RlpA family protein [Bacteroidia bacterium]|nr:septal ring lytic transglycosylase RlpA family protein [Bacteroidia bacterium]MDW8015250.1 septal ring lytic transglycosylase RlpA family protein [Bacteroidia bacterium]
MRYAWILVGFRLLIAQIGYVEEGEASYYAPSFHGRRTASGEKYDRQAMTAAHRTLPFGTFVRVTDQTNGRSVVVRINDRGPHRPGRIIDLSEKAARELGLIEKGITRVRLEVTQVPAPIEPIPSPLSPFYTTDGKTLQPKPYGVQIGAFSDENNARVLARNAANEVRVIVFIWRAEVKGRPLFRVVAGHFERREEAQKLRDRLKRDGWQAFVVHLSV